MVPPLESRSPSALVLRELGMARVACFGRRASSRQDAWAACAGSPVNLAWGDQIHSNTVLHPSVQGSAGSGDALVTRRRDLGLAVVTADCVPVFLADPDQIAAVHAGWRGLENGVLRKTLDCFEDPAKVQALIGPAIGVCCYEVSDEIAHRVAATASPEVVRATLPRPHLDLERTAEVQLTGAGVRDVTRVGLCTRCEPELWSFRGDGERAGRNLSFVWWSPPAS